MKEINVRTLFRNFKSLFPIPADGIRVLRREGDFYIYKEKKRKEKDVNYLINKVAEKAPDTVFEKNPSAPITCDLAFIIPGQRCSAIADKHVKIASLQDGDPMPSDWKSADLCSHHLEVIKTMNSFSVEES